MSISSDPIPTTGAVDVIEKIVYDFVKPLGFRRFGRTLHRFVEGDISQVIHFQNGCPQKGIPGLLWVNLGIRVPECQEKTFTPSLPLKKYYQEYQCNIRTTLSFCTDGKDVPYRLWKNPQKIAADIICKLEQSVLPVFDILNSRDAILKYREDYPRFDQMNHLVLLEAAMIWGRRGDFPEACGLFRRYYAQVTEERKNALENGRKIYLEKGQSLSYLNEKTGKTETVLAEKSGYYTIFHSPQAHLEYLKQLASQLNIPLENL